MPYADPIKRLEYSKAHSKKWYAENKERRLQLGKIWDEANPEKRLGYSRKFNAKNPQRWADYPRTSLKRRETHLKNSYGISIAEFEKMRVEQNNGCKTCGVIFSTASVRTRVCIDHDHKTGIVRGLLCHPCNVALGLLKENIQTLRNIINYISTPKEIYS